MAYFLGYLTGKIVIMVSGTAALWLSEKYILKITATLWSAWLMFVGIYATNLFVLTVMKSSLILNTLVIFIVDGWIYVTLLRIFGKIHLKPKKLIVGYLAAAFGFVVFMFISAFLIGLCLVL